MWTLWPYLKHSTYICKNIASILISADVNFEMPRSPFFFNLCAILAVGGLSTWWMSNEIRHQDIMVTIIQTFSWQAFLPSDTLGSLIKTFACDLSTQQYIWHLFHHALHKYGYCCLFVRQLQKYLSSRFWYMYAKVRESERLKHCCDITSLFLHSI